jgi:hypothetical protein
MNTTSATTFSYSSMVIPKRGKYSEKVVSAERTTVVEMITNLSMINLGYITGHTQGIFGAMKTATTKNSGLSDDAEIALMSESEIKEVVAAMFGSWADRDDLPESWLEDGRASWDDRFNELYGNNTENNSF